MLLVLRNLLWEIIKVSLEKNVAGIMWENDFLMKGDNFKALEYLPLLH